MCESSKLSNVCYYILSLAKLKDEKNQIRARSGRAQDNDNLKVKSAPNLKSLTKEFWFRVSTSSDVLLLVLCF